MVLAAVATVEGLSGAQHGRTVLTVQVPTSHLRCVLGVVLVRMGQVSLTHDKVLGALVFAGDDAPRVVVAVTAQVSLVGVASDSLNASSRDHLSGMPSPLASRLGSEGGALRSTALLNGVVRPVARVHSPTSSCSAIGSVVTHSAVGVATMDVPVLVGSAVGTRYGAGNCRPVFVLIPSNACRVVGLLAGVSGTVVAIVSEGQVVMGVAVAPGP